MGSLDLEPTAAAPGSPCALDSDKITPLAFLVLQLSEGRMWDSWPPKLCALILIIKLVLYIPIHIHWVLCHWRTLTYTQILQTFSSSLKTVTVKHFGKGKNRKGPRPHIKFHKILDNIWYF